MATVRVEWITIGRGRGADGHSENVLKGTVGIATKLTVDATATAAATRPVAPEGSSFARVSSTLGNVIVSWGSDPTASQTNGIIVMQGTSELVPVDTGHKLSFIEFA